VLRNAKDEPSAREKALEVARDIGNGRTAAKAMTAAESLVWDQAKKALAACGARSRMPSDSICGTGWTP
jgi:hypothetical protein